MCIGVELESRGWTATMCLNFGFKKKFNIKLCEIVCLKKKQKQKNLINPKAAAKTNLVLKLELKNVNLISKWLFCAVAVVVGAVNLEQDK